MKNYTRQSIHAIDTWSNNVLKRKNKEKQDRRWYLIDGEGLKKKWKWQGNRHGEKNANSAILHTWYGNFHLFTSSTKNESNQSKYISQRKQTSSETPLMKEHNLSN